MRKTSETAKFALQKASDFRNGLVLFSLKAEEELFYYPKVRYGIELSALTSMLYLGGPIYGAGAFGLGAVVAKRGVAYRGMKFTFDVLKEASPSKVWQFFKEKGSLKEKVAKRCAHAYLNKPTDRNRWMLRKMLQYGVNLPLRDCNKEGITLLIKAIKMRDFDLVDELIEAGADVNQPNQTGEFTPLHYSSQVSSCSSGMELIENGADVHVKTKDGENMLQVFLSAKGIPQTRVVDYLLKAGLDTSFQDKNGRTILHLACGSEDSIMKVLANSSCQTYNINALDAFSNTPLHYMTSNPIEMHRVEAMLKRGADPDVPNFLNRTPIDLIFKKSPSHDKGEIIDLLLQYSQEPEKYSSLKEEYQSVLEAQRWGYWTYEHTLQHYYGYDPLWDDNRDSGYKAQSAANLLGVSKDASLQELKEAFKAKLFLYHPDKAGEQMEGAQKNMQEYKQAFALLKSRHQPR